ncbi:MAG: 2-amino-4-hydroxy-6-hydroxymethyldihydropteridine diphosphokinase [Opitutaceae bacterium]
MSATQRTRQAFVGAGANLGDRAATLAKALERLREWSGVEALETSSIYETRPVGLLDQPMFLNLAAGIETTLSPEELLRVLMEIEHEGGRTRSVRWGPRTLDLDLLAFEGETRDLPELTLPHPRMFERAFVTIPLAELLGRRRFGTASWDSLRARLGSPKIEEGMALFSRESGGERS